MRSNNQHPIFLAVLLAPTIIAQPPTAYHTPSPKRVYMDGSFNLLPDQHHNCDEKHSHIVCKCEIMPQLERWRQEVNTYVL